ncbi:MAG: carbamoyltransferase HypF [Pyrinomonadaceae bacterium]
MITRSQILVRGLVQGVGFRPFVYSQASLRDLRGRVRNNTAGVLIEVEGKSSDIEKFVSDLTLNAPPLSAIESVDCNHNLAPADYANFAIMESAYEGEKFVAISPDVSTCNDCLAELFDPQNRRYRYPFINCTNCGPRFTIIENVPYDREQTTMREFEMCAACRREYEDPLNRRFHAEPVACPECGPRLFLTQAEAKTLPDVGDAINETRALLAQGRIVAIKGIGGFHLVCDALNADAVALLRARKYREDKPFAMMASSVAVIRKYCEVSDEAEQLLLAPQRPIVLLRKREGCQISPAVAPGVNNLGFILPYSPLHQLLLADLDRPLVMTSGNISDEPICFTDEAALQHLDQIADYFLLHDRRIHMRTDDSVVRVHRRREMIVRRSRGYAPAPLRMGFHFAQQVLACGAELKNTFCLGRENHAFISHHIGDLKNLETLNSFHEGIEHCKRLFDLKPDVVAYDLHPDYLSSKYAQGLDDAFAKIGVQHHHAHIASCMADNQIDGDVIGVAMDGLGFGTDGRLWGGEFFVANFADAERVAHLEYMPLPGGEMATREPWRMAAVYLQQTFGDAFLNLELDAVSKLNRDKWATLNRMIVTRTNSPETSSMGRLFDAVAALLGVRSFINYEGQAAIELEGLVDAESHGSYQFGVNEVGVITAREVIREAVADLLNGTLAPTVSARFHRAVARLIAEVAGRVREKRKINRVALSGGVFQNIFLLEESCELLQRRGFEVYTHNQVPANDGGISLGQAAVANAQISLGRL